LKIEEKMAFWGTMYIDKGKIVIPQYWMDDTLGYKKTTSRGIDPVLSLKT
jgi:hypothetical protein